ncbi:Uncharacterised protein [Pseudomonas aeruginosa]|nr:Uncharacterised protein [Pseudomonas aeruginosa]
MDRLQPEPHQRGRHRQPQVRRRRAGAQRRRGGRGIRRRQGAQPDPVGAAHRLPVEHQRRQPDPHRRPARPTEAAGLAEPAVRRPGADQGRRGPRAVPATLLQLPHAAGPQRPADPGEDRAHPPAGARRGRADRHRPVDRLQQHRPAEDRLRARQTLPVLRRHRTARFLRQAGLCGGRAPGSGGPGPGRARPERRPGCLPDRRPGHLRRGSYRR